MVLAHPPLPRPPPSNQSATRLVPTPRCGRRRPPGPSSQKVGAGTRRAEAPCAAAREAARGLRRREGAPATGASRGHPLGGAADRPARQHPGPARPQPADPPQLHIPSSRTAGRARVTGPKTTAFPGPRARGSGGEAAAGPRAGACSAQPWARRREAAANSDPPRAGKRSPGAGSPPFPAAAGPARPGGPRSRECTHFHIAALVLKALDAVVLQARVLGHGCARLRRRLLLRRRRVSVREGEVEERGRGRGRGWGEESTFRDASEREVAAAPGPAQADCRVGRGRAGPALRNRARFGRLLSRARGGSRAWTVSWRDVPGLTG